MHVHHDTNKDLGTENKAKIGPHPTIHKTDEKHVKTVSKCSGNSPKALSMEGKYGHMLKVFKIIILNHTHMVQNESK